MLTVEILLPRLAGTRELARDLVAKVAAELGPDVHALVAARLLTTGTTSFADELLRSLVDRGVREVELAGAPLDFANLMTTVAERQGFTGLQVEWAKDLQRA